MVENVGQLPCECIEFVVGQGKACQVRHMGDVFPAEARVFRRGHGSEGRATVGKSVDRVVGALRAVDGRFDTFEYKDDPFGR